MNHAYAPLIILTIIVIGVTALGMTVLYILDKKDLICNSCIYKKELTCDKHNCNTKGITECKTFERR